MKKTEHDLNEELRPEYDFAAMRGGVRDKYAGRIRNGTNIVLLEPEIAEAFPNEDAVNEALRGILNTARAVQRTGGLGKKALQPARPRKKAAIRRTSRGNGASVSEIQVERLT